MISSSACATSSVSTTNSVRIRRSATPRLPTSTRHRRGASTESCASPNMATTTKHDACATTETSDGATARFTSTKPWLVSRSVFVRAPPAGPSAMARSCSARSPTKATACANPNTSPVDMWTMQTHRPQAHRTNNNRPERNRNCVTYVAGLNCYPCCRLLKKETPMPETSAPIIAGTRIGHVHLKVADLDRALGFYCGVLGFELMQRLPSGAAFVSAGGYHHHIGLNTWESKGGHPPPPGTTGLFHTAILYPTRPALADALHRLMEAKIPLHGASNHGVSEALYLRNPDANGVELY